MSDTLPPASPPGRQRELKLYVVITIDGDDEVVATTPVKSMSLGAAVKIAETLVMARPSAVGFEIWRGGRKRYSTFPKFPRLSQVFAFAAGRRRP